MKRYLAVAVAVLALAIPSAAFAEYNLFYNGDITPGQTKSTVQAANRWTKLMFWVVETRCVSMWYRNQNSSVDYYKLTDCSSSLQDNRNSTAPAWAYCKNESSFTVNAQCYTCINTPGSCP
jgi:hypothetical protein